MRVATSKKHGKKNTSGKVLASVALVAAAAGVAGLGTYGSFTSTTSASATVTAGTVKVALGQAGATNRFSVAATGLVPGDTIQRAVTLSNTGNQDLGSLSLTTSAADDLEQARHRRRQRAAAEHRLLLDGLDRGGHRAGLHLHLQRRPTSVVLASRPVVGANVALTNLTSLTSGKTDNLRVNLAFPTTADNTFQGLSSVINFDFTGTQRAATNR